MTSEPKPSLFIGSSVEGLTVAYALQQNLDYDAEPTVWPQGIFRPTAATLHDLLAAARKADFAAFVFTPDDVRTMRAESAPVPRDNVIFELGLFIGARGPDRCFFIMPRDEVVHVPTDLIGLKHLHYMANRQDGNVVAALGPAANEIRSAMQTLGRAFAAEIHSAPLRIDPAQGAAEFVARWNAEPLLSARQVARGGMPLHMMEDETGDATKAMRLLFAFLESMADGVLSGRIDERRARVEFADPLRSVWSHASIFLAPLNQADEWWDPLPKLAELDRRWRGQPE